MGIDTQVVKDSSDEDVSLRSTRAVCEPDNEYVSTG